MGIIEFYFVVSGTISTEVDATPDLPVDVLLVFSVLALDFTNDYPPPNELDDSP